MVIVFLLYMILTWIALFFRMFFKATYTMSPQLVARVSQADSVCLARMMQNAAPHVHMTAYEAFLLTSKNPTLLMSYKWHSTEPFAHIDRASLQCEWTPKKIAPPPPVVPVVADVPAVPEVPAVVLPAVPSVPSLQPIQLERQTTVQLPEEPVAKPFEAIVEIPVEELPYWDEKPPERLWVPAVIKEKHENEKLENEKAKTRTRRKASKGTK